MNSSRLAWPVVGEAGSRDRAGYDRLRLVAIPLFEPLRAQRDAQHDEASLAVDGAAMLDRKGRVRNPDVLTWRNVVFGE